MLTIFYLGSLLLAFSAGYLCNSFLTARAVRRVIKRRLGQ